MQSKKTTDVITERPIFVRIGLFWFLIRPLTLAQIWEIGNVVEDMKEINFEGTFYPVAKMMEHKDDVKQCEKLISTVIFRSNWKRKLFGWYIRRHLTMKTYAEVFTYAMSNFNASFFLTSITSLKGIETMTSPTNTHSQTVHGDSSEE